MAKQNYFPRAESAQVEWLINYRAKISTHGPTCGIGALEITATLQDIDYLLYVCTWHSTLQADLQEATAYKKNQMNGSGPIVPLPAPTSLSTPPASAPPGTYVRLQGQVQRIKNHPGYTAMIGQDLQIVGAENTTTHDAPEYTLEVEEAAPNQKVVVNFKKFGHDGVQIEMRRPQFGGTWVFLSTDTRTPYTDTTPLQAGNQPETREYRLRFWDAGEANGEYTGIKGVTVR